MDEEISTGVILCNMEIEYALDALAQSAFSLVINKELFENYLKGSLASFGAESTRKSTYPHPPDCRKSPFPGSAKKGKKNCIVNILWIDQAVDHSQPSQKSNESHELATYIMWKGDWGDFDSVYFILPLEMLTTLRRC